MVLGVLSVMVIMAVAFAISMRTERVAAGNYADSVSALANPTCTNWRGWQGRWMTWRDNWVPTDS